MSIVVTHRRRHEVTFDGLINGYNSTYEDLAKITTRILPTSVPQNRLPFLVWNVARNRKEWSVSISYPYDGSASQVTSDRRLEGESYEQRMFIRLDSDHSL